MITSKTIALAIGFGSLLVITAIVMSAWVVGTGRKAKAAITKDAEYGRLAEDYRGAQAVARPASRRSEDSQGG